MVNVGMTIGFAPVFRLRLREQSAGAMLRPTAPERHEPTGSRREPACEVAVVIVAPAKHCKPIPGAVPPRQNLETRNLLHVHDARYCLQHRRDRRGNGITLGQGQLDLLLPVEAEHDLNLATPVALPLQGLSDLV